MELDQKINRWIENLLKKRGYEAIINLTFPDYDNTGGAAGDIIFVNVEVKNKQEKQLLELLIKKNKEDMNVSDGLDIFSIYKNEVNVYSKIIPYFNEFARRKNTTIFENIPFCYGTIVEDKNYVILQENLKTKGYQLNDSKKPQTLTHVKLVVEAYANWCALNLAVKDQEPQVFKELANANSGLIGTKLLDMLVTTYKKEIDYIIKLYEEKNVVSSSEIVEKLKQLQDKCARIFQETHANKDEDYLILRHGDCWNNNFLFHYNEDPNEPDNVKILDWQLCSLGSPLADLTQYLFFCCTPKELSNLDELLNLYYKIFSEKIRKLGRDPDKCFPQDCFLKSFKRYAEVAIAGMFIAIRFSCTTRSGRMDVRDFADKEDFLSVLDGTIDDPEDYFKRFNDMLVFALERGFI